MREISLITGQLHRAIYNLNEEARRTANQKFESGLPSAPERSLKKAFDQFRDSLQQGDSQVRRRTASLLVTLIRSFDQIVPAFQPEILEMVKVGLADADPLVREATVESYSLLLEKIDEAKIADLRIDDERLAKGQSQDQPLDSPIGAGDAAVDALGRLLRIAVSDPTEIVREAAVVGVAVQKSEAIQQAGVSFLIDHVQHNRHRFACRSVASLAEFPTQQHRYLDVLDQLLKGSDARFRNAALTSALRLAKLDSLPTKLLPNVTRRLFDSEPSVAAAARKVVQTAMEPIGRRSPSVAAFLTECLWLSKQEQPRQHSPAILETKLVRENLADCQKLCHDRAVWLRQSRAGVIRVDLIKDANAESLAMIVDDLVHLDGRSAMGWIAGAFVRLAELEA